MKEVSLKIDCSVSVETDLREWAIVPKCFFLLSVLMSFYVMHLLYNGNLVYHINAPALIALGNALPAPYK